MRAPSIPRGWRKLGPTRAIFAGDKIRCLACARTGGRTAAKWSATHYWTAYTVAEARARHVHNWGGLEFIRRVPAKRRSLVERAVRRELINESRRVAQRKARTRPTGTVGGSSPPPAANTEGKKGA